ncbi:hypothetical protein HF313_14610 [Massilia atriviolacea]|uniref:Uncharacterized protein n=1 Tax=Massilia atriviolacea TaxID=2495579 RepID=A0A430HR00_9BURK|nr:hypothetical protein [Massilia atriviolacea]RSZ59950.1 hypothetical protein EJB06_07145 [Massilia atriviolacea]
MKENDVKVNQEPDRKLLERLLLSPRVEGDRLMLADAVLLAALDGSHPLNRAELAALRASPLTLRRFRQLSIARRNGARAANDEAWSGSAGMLRAADDGADLERLLTDDGHWSLHFVAQDGAWRLILSLDAAAPFAARLLREQPMLRVVDGGGAILLQGRLDADGEVECGWPFEGAPAPHFQQFGAHFAVEPVHV